MEKIGIWVLLLLLGVAIVAFSLPTQESSCNGTCANGITEALIKERCTVCHNTDRIYKAKKDEKGWAATVDTMIGKGAKLSSDERLAVIDLLTKGICDNCKDQQNP